MIYRRQRTARHGNESGQALVFMVLALSIFLLGAGALCVDMSNLWFHRQAAQNAADAACTAGAMDLLVGAQGGAIEPVLDHGPANTPPGSGHPGGGLLVNVSRGIADAITDDPDRDPGEAVARAAADWARRLPVLT